jgi:hypothetical protein
MHAILVQCELQVCLCPGGGRLSHSVTIQRQHIIKVLEARLENSSFRQEESSRPTNDARKGPTRQLGLSQRHGEVLSENQKPERSCHTLVSTEHSRHEIWPRGTGMHSAMKLIANRRSYGEAKAARSSSHCSGMRRQQHTLRVMVSVTCTACCCASSTSPAVNIASTTCSCDDVELHDNALRTKQ